MAFSHPNPEFFPSLLTSRGPRSLHDTSAPPEANPTLQVWSRWLGME